MLTMTLGSSPIETPIGIDLLKMFVT